MAAVAGGGGACTGPTPEPPHCKNDRGDYWHVPEAFTVQLAAWNFFRFGELSNWLAHPFPPRARLANYEAQSAYRLRLIFFFVFFSKTVFSGEIGYGESPQWFF
jgi:hypothetical protein